MNDNPELYLGSKVKDTISGFEGVCTSYSVHISGTVRLCIEASDTHGEFIEHWQHMMFVNIIEQKFITIGFKK